MSTIINAPITLAPIIIDAPILLGNGGVGGPSGAAIVESPTAPDDTSVIWADPETGVTAIYIGGAWVTQPDPPPAGPSGLTTVTPSSPLPGESITSLEQVDETHYLTPAQTLAALTWNLPTAANSRAGQVKVIFSRQPISALTVNVLGGGTKIGTPLTSAQANEAYSYQCVSTSGAGTWIRLS